ncbi:HNH endonuclease family protein [Amycolatopsis sp. NPDC006131]|uniref:HNH endonuclease family protein n=1 Tax=Amycolatopsis sp. NPDC006131 TaxID=3156731 RepID=UPI0033BE3DBB
MKTTALAVASVFLIAACGTVPAEDQTQTSYAVGELAKLDVRPEDSGAHYNRDEWGDWTTEDGCTTRERVLIRDGIGTRHRSTDCRITAGTWESIYDGAVITDPRDVDIDHVVPVAEANQSGARDWTVEQRRGFYNDMDNLVAVSGTSNRRKSDQDPATWLPQMSARCWYAARYVDVKYKYFLTIDQREYDALAGVLRGC